MHINVKKSLFQFLDDHINDGDTVILYHSLVYIDAIKNLFPGKKSFDYSSM